MGTDDGKSTDDWVGRDDNMEGTDDGESTDDGVGRDDDDEGTDEPADPGAGGG